MPTLREALKKLDAMGAIEVKHGSGIFVGEHINSLFLMIQIEVAAAGLAAKNADDGQIKAMENILREAGENLHNDAVLNELNINFHHEISSASGNSVFSQIIGVLSHFFQNEQLLLIDIFSSKKKDHDTHLRILDAIRDRDEKKAMDIMRKHLESVRDAIENWDFDKKPVMKIKKMDLTIP